MLGVVFCCVDERATRIRQELEAALRNAVPGRCFETCISQSIAIQQSAGRGQTLFQSSRYRTHKTTAQYLRLALEIEHRVTHRSLFLSGTLPRLDLDDQALLRMVAHRNAPELCAPEGRLTAN